MDGGGEGGGGGGGEGLIDHTSVGEWVGKRGLGHGWLMEDV